MELGVAEGIDSMDDLLVIIDADVSADEDCCLPVEGADPAGGSGMS